MAAEAFLTKYDFDQFTWKHVDGSPPHFVRPLAGVEKIQELYIRFEQGNQIMFFAVALDFAAPISESAVVSAARAAWMALRYQIPIVATSIEIGSDGVAMFKYPVVGVAQVEEWAKRTLPVHHQPVLDLNQLREALGAQKVPSAEDDQTWMHLVLPSPDDAGSVSQIGFIFHTHHSVTDGNGSKIIVNQYLAEFAKQLENPEKAAGCGLGWGEGKEGENLTPSIFGVLGSSEPLPVHPSSDEEPSFSHPVYKALLAEMQNIGASLTDRHGFKPRAGDKGWPSARRVELLFSKEESTAMLNYMKSQPYTLTVLAHAALAMVVMANNPASPETAKLTMNNFYMRDVRPRLKAPYSSRNGYAGYALAPPMLRLPVSLFLSPEETPLPLEKSLLLDIMGEIRKRYEEHQQMAIAYIGHGADMVVAGLKGDYAADRYSVNQCYLMSSDGPGEKLLDSTFKTANGETLFNVSKFFTSINHPHPAPFFRLTSWKGIIGLEADFNANLISANEVNKHLAEWKHFMFLIMN